MDDNLYHMFEISPEKGHIGDIIFWCEDHLHIDSPKYIYARQDGSMRHTTIFINATKGYDLTEFKLRWL